MGTIVSVAGLYSGTSIIKPSIGFPILAVLQIVWIVIILGTGMIKEPTQMSKAE